jgi:hypothetical protein
VEEERFLQVVVCHRPAVVAEEDVPVKAMQRFFLLFFSFILFLSASSQNDLDAIRYSRLSTGGSARFNSMGGAFGALGADLSCAAVNPAGLGLYKNGDLCFGFGAKFTHDQGVINGKSSTIDDARVVFNTFGGAFTWPAKNNPQSRHLLAFTVNQLQNFNDKYRMASYTNSASIAKDMLNIAQQKASNHDSLFYGYEGAAFDVYVLDTFQGKYFSFVDLKRTVLQVRDVVTQGRVNDVGLSYSYSSNDKFYFGLSVGLPKVTYTSSTTHTETDDKDSMRVTITSTTGAGSYTTTYIDGLPGVYPDKLGFHSLTYTEYFQTTGSGFNLKIGGVYRINDEFRVGAWIHTPTIYTLRDVYYNSMSASFDADPKNPLQTKYPANEAYFDYKIITPPKLGLSGAYVDKEKRYALGVDYELINYAAARLSSSNPSDFAGVNAVIQHKYKYGSNLRVGGELNMKPVFFRAGYNMQGSPFGNAFSGTFVRNIISLGIGTRIENLYFDVSWYKYLSSEDYYMFTTITQKAKINFNSSQLSITAGIKF